MIRPKFEEEQAYFPVTMAQFEALTNEMLIEVNKVTEPHSLNGDYMAQVVMGALHGTDKKQGILNKTELFDACIHFISNHVTYHAVEAIKARLTAEANKNNPQPLAAVPDLEVEH
jgi:hypothetical protein